MVCPLSTLIVKFPDESATTPFFVPLMVILALVKDFSVSLENTLPVTFNFVAGCCALATLKVNSTKKEKK